MAVIERSKVVEHRVTRQLWPWTIRYWIESDPEHGGVEDLQDAISGAAAAEAKLGDVTQYIRDDSRAVAEALFEAFPAANSVEVCSQTDGGNGTTIHRDWP